jgi:L-alanine-DL-glutamate epimerase-like enolase superfamily enzyme
MKIDFDVIPLPTKHAFHIAREAKARTRVSVWVRLRDDDGVEGWGEAAATPFYGETAETVTAVLPRYGEALEDAAAGDWFALERIERALELAVGRNPAARAALSCALHDLLGKRVGLPIWKLWGLDPATAPVSSFTIGIDAPDVVRQKVREAQAYPVLKVKVGAPGDEATLAAIRDAAPRKPLYVDANTAWTARQAVRSLAMLEAYDVALVEQPVAKADVEGLKEVRRHARIPVVADESCETSKDVAKLVGAVDGVNIKLAKCGGLREALRIVHTARAHGMGVMLGCMVESTLGIAAAVQLAPLVDWVDLDGAALLADDPFRGPGLEADGSLRFNAEPGLGVRRAGA